MANPLRVSKLRYDGDIPEGLYVVGSSSVANPGVPHLPTIGADQPSPGTYNLNLSVDLHCPELFDAYDQGDVIWVDSKQKLLRNILSRRANSNTLLVTEQCDNRCSFCSQPPNGLPDSELYHRATLALLNYNTDGYIGISGGEPTLNRNAFLAMMRILQTSNDKTKLHILTNGRSFSDQNFLTSLTDYVQGREIAWGIPIYGHTQKIHDSLVGASGAFLETINGLLNLAATGQTIELRIIPVQENLHHLGHLIEFIASALPFVSVISVMNLEPKGWARNNYERLVTSVKEQSKWLSQMVEVANVRGLDIRLFNYPLCLLPEDIRTYAAQSISDWKNYYPDQCDGCELRKNCGGFFTSAVGNFIEEVKPLIWKS
ncbi:MAG: His-Xaa-Ser system radical SAM maturase HxsC [Gammaproteobacteria bacterium]|nr:MAG: His-Xaa-Ser system radical SAM maturase HxsC [Gammaproteobacteria bacterium]